MVSVVSAKEYHYNYTDNCRKAYQHFMALQPEQGYAAVQNEWRKDPYNLMATYITDYDDMLLLLFNGDEIDYEQRKHHKDERLKMLERGDKNSPWYKMCKAGIYMHWAFVNIRFDEKLKAATNFRRSYILLKENQSRFPDFEYDDIFFGIEEAAIGALPDNYKWIVSIFGMKGNIHRGANKLKSFIDKHQPGDLFYEEALVYSAYVHYFLLSDKASAWNIVTSDEFGTDSNLVNSFVKANIALNYRKAKDAQQVLSAAQQTGRYYKYPSLDYEYAYSLLHHLDKETIQVFHSFLKAYKGEVFVKDALQKLAYAHHIFGNADSASYYKQQITEQGTETTDADKQATRFALQDKWPDKTLLKAQLLTDGGYYRDAYTLLQPFDQGSFNATADKLEYYFRWARVNDELDNKELAIAHYKKTIKIGLNRKEQFAARAALQLGFLYEKKGDTSQAKSFYNKALSMKDHDFQNAIDQQAKAGLLRLQ